MTKAASEKVQGILAAVTAIEGIQKRLRLNLAQLGTVGLFIDDADLARAEGRVDGAIADLTVLVNRLNIRAMAEFPEYLTDRQ
jgi:hypothetical protein